MGTIVIHAGMHKTGSSSIQNTLSAGIRNPNFHYFSLGEPNHCGPLVNLFKSHPENYHGNRKRGRTIEDIRLIRKSINDDLAEQLASLGDQTGILSAEDLCNFNKDELLRLRQYLLQSGHLIKVIVYVRGFYGYIDSAFQQLIKGGLSAFKPEAAAPSYSKLDNISEVFQSDDLYFIPFFPDQLHGNDVVRDFAHRLKIPLESITNTRANESLSLTSIKLIYIFRKFGPGYGQDQWAIKRNNGIVGRLSKLKGRKLTLSPGLTRNIFQKEGHDLLNLSHHLFDQVSIHRLLSDNRTEITVSSEEDLLRLEPEEIDAFVKLGERLSIDLPRNHHEYLNHDKTALLIAKLAPRVQDKPSTSPSVIRGSSNILFLAGGNHSPLAFAQGAYKASKRSINLFWQNINRRARLLEQRSISYRHLIVPDKHLICELEFPEPIKYRLADDYLVAAEGRSSYADHVIYPLGQLTLHRDKACMRVDTHLSVLGSAICLSAISESLSATKSNITTTPNLDFYDCIDKMALPGKRKYGDLGSKVYPMEDEADLCLPSNKDIVTISNNFRSGNNGICDLYFNKTLLENGPRVLIFGDSYARNIALVLSRFAGQVFFMRTPYLHDEIVNAIMPDTVITENAERYLSSVRSDHDRSLFMLYPWLKDRSYSPPQRFIEAFDAVLSYGRPKYEAFIASILTGELP
jgi:hypothetical protein